MGPAAATRSQAPTLVTALSTAYELGNTASNKQLSSRRFPREFFNTAFAVLDASLGQMLNYRQLRKHPELKEAWNLSSANEFGRLFQGIGDGTKKPSNTCFFINKQQVPPERFKDVTYCKFVCSIREQKK